MRSTVSLASEPELVKKAWFMCAGVTSDNNADSSAAGGVEVLKNAL